MPDCYNYPAEVECDEDGRFIVVFPALDEARTEARDLLRELIASTMRDGDDLPAPTPAAGHQSIVVPPLLIALKAALYEAFRESGVSQRRFARDLDIAESEVRRMLNPDHATKAATIDQTLQRLGRHVSVTVSEAA